MSPDWKTILVIAGCVVTLAGVIAYALRKVVDVLVLLLGTHLKSLERKLDERGAEVADALKGQTAAMRELTAALRSPEPPQPPGVVTPTSELDTNPIYVPPRAEPSQGLYSVPIRKRKKGSI